MKVIDLQDQLYRKGRFISLFLKEGKWLRGRFLNWSLIDDKTFLWYLLIEDINEEKVWYIHASIIETINGYPPPSTYLHHRSDEEVITFIEMSFEMY
ncbi:hypothetical protein [Cohnella abietis]|uniref:Uncharacterized protein n=1 Tax=Cohnella abietis TaxID=2507935 RepID=A0A3T1CY78_9BACL|nr:hypothetical protein [Cohnella abietis]BBI30729.1 hypothetical protein KCTCHS21_01280 [Cohnella abietis]